MNPQERREHMTIARERLASIQRRPVARLAEDTPISVRRGSSATTVVLPAGSTLADLLRVVDGLIYRPSDPNPFPRFRLWKGAKRRER